MIYLDNAATSLQKPAAVGRAMQRALECFGNPSRGANNAVLTAARQIAEARDALARLFCAPSPGRVVFTKNATEALNIAIASVQGHVVTTEAEHNSVLRPVHHHGNYTVVKTDSFGRYGVDDIRAALQKDTGAVVVAHAGNLSGYIAPVAEIGSLCHSRGVLLIVDAAQTAGLLPIDMAAMNIDALCFTGHKSLFGPQGTGGLCLAESFTPGPLLFGGSGSRSFGLTQPAELPDLLEAGTLNGHGIAGLLAGAEYVQKSDPDTLYRAADHLSNLFYQNAQALPGVQLYGPPAGPRMPIVALNLSGFASSELAALLNDRYNIAVRPGIHCAPLLHRRFGTEQTGAVRFSFSHYNNEYEVDTAVRALKEIVAEATQT